MKNFLVLLFSILTPYEKRKFILLCIASVLLGGLNVIAVYSIMPFLHTASNPEQIQKQEYLQLFYQYFNFSSTQNFLFALGLLTIATITIANMGNIILHWGIDRFTYLRSHSISASIFKKLLHRPYSYFINNDVLKLQSLIVSETQYVSEEIIHAIFTALIFGTTLVLIIIMLIVDNPTIALSVSGSFAILYYFFFLNIRKKIRTAGAMVNTCNQQTLNNVTSPIRGIKDIKLKGCEEHFIDIFHKNSHLLACTKSKVKAYVNIPKYLIESLAYSTIVCLTIVFIKIDGSIQNAIPTIGLYAFATHRMLPSTRLLFASLTNIKYRMDSLNKVRNEIEEAVEINHSTETDYNLFKDNVETSLKIKNISFSYIGSKGPVINNFSLSIEENQKVGIVGRSGTGKTTIVDLLSGLLTPDSGTIEFSGVTISSKNAKAWRRYVGYVPQDCFIVDGSLKANIAFGVSPNKYDLPKIIKCAELAGIKDHIEKNMSLSYDTVLGENGVSLSGGQKQRITIARALYFDPKIIIFDESTSSLDNITENIFRKAIDDISKFKTIIIVTHKLDSVKNCDSIVLLNENGQYEQGTYEELKLKSDHFIDLINGEQNIASHINHI